MRTTVDLPEDVHVLARALAHDGGQTFSEVIVALIRRGIQGGAVPTADVGVRGMPLVAVDRVVTADDVRSLEDE